MLNTLTLSATKGELSILVCANKKSLHVIIFRAFEIYAYAIR